MTSTTNSDTEAITRILFRDFAPWQTITFYIVAIAAIAVFFFGCFLLIRKYRRGAPLEATGVGARLWAMVKDVATHRPVKRRAEKTGRSHASIFYGFLLLFIGTSTITLNYDITRPLFGINFWQGDFYLWFSLVMDVAGVALIAGLIYMMYRRKIIAPKPRLDYTRPDRSPEDSDYDRSYYRWEDWAFLWLLILIGITGFVLEGARLVWLSNDPMVWDYRWWSPVGAVVAHVMQGVGMSPEVGGAMRMNSWWIHGLMALAFIGLIPYTKAKHIFTVLGSMTMRDPKPVQRLPMGDMEAEKLGYSKITDLSWKDLLNVDACTKCGKCHEACPARATGYPLSPRDVVLTLREHSHNSLEGWTVPEDEEQLAIIGEGENQVRPETLWSCRACGACTEICPVSIEHVPMIMQMRRALVEEGEMDSMIQTTLQNVQKRGNSLGETKRKRPAWTKKLDFKIKDASKEPVDVLWFVGDFASFDPRYQQVSQSFARILHECGVDFGILYEKEMTAGNDIRRVGEEGLYQHLAETNIETLEECDFKRIVTTDPHSYNTIRNEYPEFGGNYEIEHASAMINRMLSNGDIPLKKRLDYRVTFHDPCHLGRFNKGFDPPREAVQSLGAELVEMERSRDNSFCCGAGGGRIWIPDPPDQPKINENRVREAGGIEGLDVLMVSCPKCMNMLEDGRKTAGFEDQFEVKELIELVEESMDLGVDEEDADQGSDSGSGESPEATKESPAP
ncbi:heterodisulfide reductase-related iron-sulfur binding cluster [Thiohalorhabdus methylotrophus]|uniref:Heterodisulfide reductase-related iron-sulfur binding cluster n=1 Tax=Thiohalorhabdus methylotrophus TaxID=3242694 RepID=A0ABV4TV79_9GAMM